MDTNEVGPYLVVKNRFGNCDDIVFRVRGCTFMTITGRMFSVSSFVVYDGPRRNFALMSMLDLALIKL